MKKLIFMVAIMAATLIQSCGSDTSSIDHYVSDNNSTEIRNEIFSSGVISDYNIVREGYDVVSYFTFNDSINLDDIDTDVIIENSENNLNFYLADMFMFDYALEAVKLMAKHDGKLKFIYLDNYDHEIEATLPAMKIYNAYKKMDNDAGFYKYIEQQNDPELVQTVLEMGYSKYKATNDSDNVVFIYNSDDIFTDEDIDNLNDSETRAYLIQCLVDEYNENEVARDCVNYLAVKNGNIVYRYIDSTDRSTEILIPAKEIFDEAN